MPPVLVVDDDPDAIFLSRRALLKAGLKNPIVTVASGEEAVAYLRNCCLAAGSVRGRKPVALFLDVHMPRMDGFKVLRWVRKKKAFGRMKKFILTTSDSPADRAQALELGADGYLVKHPTPEAMAQAVRDALAPPPHRRSRDPTSGPGT